MAHSEWSNANNTPSPLYFPEASPTPKLASTPSKKPVSPIDWQHQLDIQDISSPAGDALPNSKGRQPGFSFDGDLTRPDLDVILDKLQQSTLSADTMTSSFLGDLDDDVDIVENDNIYDLLVQARSEDDDQVLMTADPALLIAQQQQREIQKASDSQQLQQWLQHLPHDLATDDVPAEAGLASASSHSDVKRASLVHVGKQLMTRMRRAASTHHKRTTS
ncbi:hypothetical protein DM01DRAFT_1334948 [Hesseltinella vesiculosa]|uniref:Uncharacterized protein n=1 Tax=Hesseltinella vesiculosa TaxID=101127 RepID=A0A1X2GJV0_9FUNG|nr:hypothetical protein DM01DRAFT_1334948 [Hesseltinella vesiculosa]